MLDNQRPDEIRDEPIAVTLKLDPKVYEFFKQKAQTAGVGIETYLGSTLSIVLGCRAFSKMSVCSPQFPGEGCATDDAK